MSQVAAISSSVTLTEIVEVIGEAAALKLVHKYGGTSPRLPAMRNCSPEHELAELIGLDLLTQLVSVTGGARWLYVPKCAQGLRESRNREIVAAYTAGEPVESIARRYNLSDRQVWNILKNTVMDDGQSRLF